MPKKPIPLSALADAAMSRRSPLYTWMMTHHDDFKEIIDKAVRPNWTKLAEEFASNGLTDGEGNPPTAECTRQTWWRVRKAVAARRATAAKRTGAGSLPLSTPAAIAKPTQPPPSVTPQPMAASDDNEDEEEIEITMGDGTPRKVRVPKQR